MPMGQVALLPTGYEGADEIIRLTDLAMVYGGQNVADKYSGPNVLIRGPGRAKLLISRPHEWRDLLDVMVESVVKGGGVGCTNATCIWIGPWNRADGIAPLRDSVHLSLITDDQDLVEASLNDPSIRSTFVGKVPTTFADPSVPHEGFVSEFLMQPKGYVRR